MSEEKAEAKTAVETTDLSRLTRFSDFAKDTRNLQGAKISMNAVIGKEIAVLGYRVFPSTKSFERDGGPSECMQLQFELEGDRCVAFTSSKVLIRQMRDYQDHLPFLATIVRRQKYFTFS